MGSRPTIQMVADMAGVSRGTVDRVINNRSYVSEKVRERILKAIREIGYVSPKEFHSQQPKDSRHLLTLGVLLPNWVEPFQAEIHQGIRCACDELKKSDVRILIHHCETDLPQEALGLLDAMRSEKAAGFAICAVNDPSIEKWIATRMAEGIPCVTFNSDLPESGRLCFVGQDIRQSGRVAAELLHKCVSSQGLILVAVGNLKFDGQRQRLEGFQSRMDELNFPAEQILIQETFHDYKTTFRAVQEVLKATPNLRGIYMANPSVSACCAAIDHAGKQGQIRVVCHEINESVRQLIRLGFVDFTIPQDYVQQGYAPLLLLQNHICQKGSIKQNCFYGQMEILCAENLI